MSDAAATAGRTEFIFDSADGRSQVRAVLWVPLSMERADAAFGEPELGCFKPRGVVQLIHGMAEHIDRYDDFARFLADAGYLVAGHDHIGHGDTAGAPERRGVIDAEGGADAMIEDAQMLRLLVSQQVAPGTPYFIFGHSMGSLVLRSYLPRYGSGLAGAIICGTANEPVAVSRAGNLAARAIARHLQDTTGISIKRIIRALKPLQEVTINLNGHHLTAADPLTPEAEEILTALSIPTGH